jgi:hypothetical protein
VLSEKTHGSKQRNIGVNSVLMREDPPNVRRDQLSSAQRKVANANALVWFSILELMKISLKLSSLLTDKRTHVMTELIVIIDVSVILLQE